MGDKVVEDVTKIRPESAVTQTTWSQQLAVIAEIGQVVNAGQNLDDTLTGIMARLKSLIDYTAAEISLWHEKKQAMIVCAQAGDPRYTRNAKGVYMPDEGYTGWLTRRRQPLLIEDRFKREDIRPKADDDDRPIRSFLGVPFQKDRRRFGTIELVSDTPQAFDSGDVQLLKVISEYVVTAIQNAQLIKTEQLQADYLAAVHQVSTAANSTVDSSEIFRRSLVEILRVINLEQGGVTLFDYEGGYGYTIIEHPPYPDFKGPTAPIRLINNPLIESILAHKHPLAVEDALIRDERLAVIKESREFWEIKSFLLAPLVIKDQVIGTIDLYAVRTKRKFTENELNLVETMANQVSIAINNTQLLEQVEKRVSVLNTVHGAGQVIISSLDLDEILKQIVEQAWNLATYRGKKTSLATIRLVEQSKIKLAAFYPLENSLETHSLLDQEVDLADEEGRLPSAVKQVIKTGKPQRIGNIPGRFENRNSHTQTRSELAVPIKLKNEIVGVISVEHANFNAFDRDDQYGMEFLAGQAAIAIQNARLFDETERHARLLQAAAKVARRATSILDENKLLSETVHLIVDSFAFFYHAGVFLLDKKGEYAVLRAASSEDGQRMLRRGHKLKVGQQGIVGFVTQSGEFRLTSDVRKDPHHYKNPDLPKTRAEMAFPLIARGKVIGALDVQSTQVVDLSEEDIATLQTMADQLANAIYNAQLYHSEQENVQALQVIQANSATVSAILELDKLLPSITEKAVEIFDMPAASVMLWDEQQENLVIRAAYGLSDEYKLKQQVNYHTVNQHFRELALRPYVIDLRRDPQGVPEFIEREGLFNVLVAPLMIGTRLIGTLNIYNKDASRQFDERQKDLAAILANHTAIAIENARRYEVEQRRVRELSGLNRISQVINALTDIQQVYQLTNMSIAELADVEMCATLLYDDEKKALVCQLPAYGVPSELGRQYVIPLRQDNLAFALWRMRGSYILNNVLESPVPVELGLTKLAKLAHVQNTLFIKLTVGNRDIGVLQASNKRDGTEFTEDDARLLTIFAGQAAAVIENARLYEELKHAMGLVSARTGLAWMGMANSVWRHAVDKHALTIREQIDLLCRNLKKLLTEEQYEKLEKRVSMIERLANKILEKPLTLPLSAEAGVESVAVNELVKERAGQLWQNDPYRTAQLQLDLALPTASTVRVSPEWLRRAFDILVDNAVNALADRDIKKIKIGSRAAGDQAEILVSDTGPGLPPHILQRIGIDFIEKPENAKGLGMGLLMAHTIVQTYGGEIRVGSTGSTGTTMIIALPLESRSWEPGGLV